MSEFVLTAPHPLSSESQNLYEIDTISPINQETQSKRGRLKKLEGRKEGRKERRKEGRKKKLHSVTLQKSCVAGLHPKEDQLPFVNEKCCLPYQ